LEAEIFGERTTKFFTRFLFCKYFILANKIILNNTIMIW